MDRRRAGKSGLLLSRLGLGTMTWGRDTDTHEAADQCRAFIKPVVISLTLPPLMEMEIVSAYLAG